MSNHDLVGTGSAIPPITASLITLSISGNPDLTEVDVGKLKTSGPITGRYDSIAKTANVKILPADFLSLSQILTSGKQVTVDYTFSDPDGTVVAFTFAPVANMVVAMADAPNSGITASESDVSEAVG